MKKSIALTFCLLLAGCSEAQWNQALNYTGLGGAAEDSTAEAATPAPAASSQAAADPNADLCRSVATQDAAKNDFDRETQQRVFARSFSQCMAIFNR